MAEVMQVASRLIIFVSLLVSEENTLREKDRCKLSLSCFAEEHNISTSQLRLGNLCNASRLLRSCFKTPNFNELAVCFHGNPQGK